MFRDLFETLAQMPHETVLQDGRLLHKAGCLRCRLQEQIAVLYAEVRLFTKKIDDSIGKYPSGMKIDV